MSDRPYNPKKIESEAQAFWKENRIFEVQEEITELGFEFELLYLFG